MANTQNPFGAMTPEQKNGATIALTQALSWLNQPQLSGGAQAASSALGNGAAPKKRVYNKKTQGGTQQQHAQAGHEGGVATAAKRKTGGRKAKAPLQQQS